MSTNINQIREKLEGLEFPNNDLKKEVYKLLNIKEAVVLSRGGDPRKNDSDEKPKPDGGPSEIDILSNSISSNIEAVEKKLRDSIQELLDL